MSLPGPGRPALMGAGHVGRPELTFSGHTPPSETTETTRAHMSLGWYGPPAPRERLKRALPADKRRELAKDLRLAPAGMHAIFRELANG